VVLIRTAEELAALNNHLNEYRNYRLVNDIDLTEFLSHTDEGWLPIGGWGVGAFVGRFDGNGHKITGLWVNRPRKDAVGLFGYADDAVIENLRVETSGEGVRGEVSTGGIVGNIRSGTIKNCNVSGRVFAESFAGGLIGYSGGDERFVANVVDCQSSVDVRADYYAGGLIGFSASGGIVEKCHANGSVIAEYSAGGLLGSVSFGKVINCYTRGDVSAFGSAGGFVGFAGHYGNTVIENCYSTGSVSGRFDTGGFVGINHAVIINSFFDIDTSGRFEGIGNGFSSGAYGRTTQQMQSEYTFVEHGWDFIHIWGISSNRNDGYPYLREL